MLGPRRGGGTCRPRSGTATTPPQLRPRYVDAFDSRGFVNLKIGQPLKALADYDAALRINPRLASSLYGRGMAKARSGNKAGATADIAAAKAIQPDVADEFAGYGVR